MSARTLVALALVAGCLPENYDTTDTTSGSSSDGSGGEPTSGGSSAGLFACNAPPCTLVIVSQTLDDRIDVHEVTGETSRLRGRIGLDLKPDPSGEQIMGNLLDEPYGLVLTPSDLLVAVGHYPDTDRGSLLRFPRSAFAELDPGATFGVDQYFSGGAFSAGVEALLHEREEGIFYLPHPSGRLLIGVFANSLKSADFSNPSELLVVDPGDSAVDAIGSFDLGAIDPPCAGGWRLEALDAQVDNVAVACDGSDSVAVMHLPTDLGAKTPKDAATAVTACGLNLGGTGWTTQFVAADGAGGLLAVQSQLAQPPRAWRVSGDCAPLGLPSMSVAPSVEAVRLLREAIRVPDAGVWLIAAGPPSPGVVIARGGGTPELCGMVSGLDALDAANTPFALALDESNTHLAIGAGPPSNPELTDGRGQVLWATLDLSGSADCEIAATSVVDLNAGLFQQSSPDTWVRAPNVILVAEVDGSDP
ncbi:MAG: hypothetical protein JNL82_41755 [Myxococcales bacterium]|nr:hypothetical protein [Myxococcales bacterium]